VLAAAPSGATPVTLACTLLDRKRKQPDGDFTIMNAFSPEFAHHWLAGQRFAPDGRPEGEREDPLSRAQQDALEQLADRVNAARSIY
jgi:hypothetical protein